MILGHRRRQIFDMSTNYLRFVDSDYSLKPIATYLTSLHSFATTAEVYNNHGKGAFPWGLGDVALFDGAACDVRLRWSPHETILPMVCNCWPREVVLECFAADPIAPDSYLNLGVLEHFIFSLGQSLLTTFVEDKKPLLKTVFGKPAAWPPIWNFARVVRNAMSHGGKIRIDDGATVRWRRLEYSELDNGREIVNVDLWPADLFVLIREMEDALPSGAQSTETKD
ncbi:hypothetical protein LPW26_20490 [Rhodopseudomonas sp. HC1]|uniref:hypothetical protein n=1 Tax=Rhodopseudomonas infernalis TaxID=2897386 RepID=UPI001EE95706|nr:hypothetical protein [Rhodopseudomonas infernalis]MCG6207030.1 hypothetical protein [Rhodopseudomonas infernalis]